MIFDLTHPLLQGMPVYPGTPDELRPSFNKPFYIVKHGFAETFINMTSHTGTHVDAPAHIFEQGGTLDEMPLDNFIGPGVVVDCSSFLVEKGVDQLKIPVDHIKKSIKNFDRVEFILFYTGCQSLWGTPEYFSSFPVLSRPAVDYLIGLSAKQRIKGIGFDAVSADPVDDDRLTNHHLLLKESILLIENLTNLKSLVNKRFELNIIPLKFQKADGSPVRAFARL